MHRFRASVGAIGGTALALMLCLAGCPTDTQLGQLADTLSTDTAKDDATFLALQELVDESTTEEALSVDDEAVNFGEDATLYTAEPAGDVELLEDSILADVGGDDATFIERGQLSGRFWNDVLDSDSDNSSGMFRGHWVAADGQPLGVIRGEYRPLAREDLPDGLAGGGFFHGRYIDTEGRFRGILRGRYGHAEDGRGLFFGRWYDRHDRLLGILKGHWDDDPEIQGGTFAGWWAAFDICEEVGSLPDGEFADNDFGGLEATDEQVVEDVDAQPYDWTQTPLDEEPDVAGANGPPPCIDPDHPHGFLRGWHWPYEHDLGDGLFHGRWRTANGNLVGVLRGHWVKNPPPDGESGDDDPAEGRILGRFYGKYVDLSGTFRGFVRGVYGRSANGVAVFRGHYYNADHEEQGVLLGRWSVAPHVPGGPFVGWWNGADLDGGE